MTNRVVLAYSGGLDTSVAIPYLAEMTGGEVIAVSLDLGAGRLTHEWFDTDPPERKKINMLRDYIDAELAGPAEHFKSLGEAGLAVGTSKTFRTLARLTGAAPSSAGPYVKRTLTAPGLRQLIAFISRMTAADRAELARLLARVAANPAEGIE